MSYSGSTVANTKYSATMERNVGNVSVPLTPVTSPVWEMPATSGTPSLTRTGVASGLSANTPYTMRVNITKTVGTPGAQGSTSTCFVDEPVRTVEAPVVIPTTTSCLQDQTSENKIVSIDSTKGPKAINILSTVADLVGKVVINGTIPSNIRYESSIGYSPLTSLGTVTNTPKYIPTGFPTTGNAVDWTATPAHVSGLASGATYQTYIRVCKQIGTKSSNVQASIFKRFLAALTNSAVPIETTTWSTIGTSESCCYLQGSQFSTIGN
jgi:hypothetical protein